MSAAIHSTRNNSRKKTAVNGWPHKEVDDVVDFMDVLKLIFIFQHVEKKAILTNIMGPVIRGMCVILRWPRIINWKMMVIVLKWFYLKVWFLINCIIHNIHFIYLYLICATLIRYSLSRFATVKTAKTWLFILLKFQIK